MERGKQSKTYKHSPVVLDCESEVTTDETFVMKVEEQASVTNKKKGF